MWKLVDALLLPSCAACGKRPAQRGPLCGSCTVAPARGWPSGVVLPGATRAEVLWDYAGELRSLLLRAKEHPGDAAAHALRRMMLEATSSGPAPQAWCVPPPSRRRRWRNWYLPDFLAAGLARRDGVRVRRLLERAVQRPSQAGLDGAARRRNLRGCFRAACRRVPARVGLVDDVLTTGATLAESVRALRAAGVEEVQVLALAAAPPSAPVASRIRAWTST